MAEIARREANTPWAKFLYRTHLALQAAGFVCDAADWLDAALYALEGKWADACWSLAASIAGFGIGMTVARWGRYAGEMAPHMDELLELTARADRRVAKYGWEGTIEAAEAAAKRGDEILPGLFRYGYKLEGDIFKTYQQHHLWPEAMGGPRNGWSVFAKSPHNQREAIQGRLNAFLQSKLGLPQRSLEKWARENPMEILKYLRQFYKAEGILFPY